MNGPACGPVGTVLAAFGEELASARAAQTGGAFTSDAAADAFLRARPEAFLIGVLFTQGIPAERAWAGPYLLAQRLGHFDLARLASEHATVAAAVARPPMLHRFKRTLPGWISGMAAQLIQRWGGDASSLWSGSPTAAELMERLRSFRGIGPKKAAMAAEILARHFGVPLREPAGGTVAYDVHVRRVFLRTGLVDHDSPGDVTRAAALVCPQAPGLLDLPAWLVGRQWCHPRDPSCDECRLSSVCPRLIDRHVSGVGSRAGTRRSASRTRPSGRA